MSIDTAINASPSTINTRLPPIAIPAGMNTNAIRSYQSLRGTGASDHIFESQPH